MIKQAASGEYEKTRKYKRGVTESCMCCFPPQTQNTIRLALVLGNVLPANEAKWEPQGKQVGGKSTPRVWAPLLPGARPGRLPRGHHSFLGTQPLLASGSSESAPSHRVNN